MRRYIVPLLAIMLVASCNQKKTPASGEIKDISPKHDHAMLIVESESCIYCKQLRKDLERQDISSQLEGMDVYSVLYESNAKVKYILNGQEKVSTEEELAKTLRVNSFPQIFFYDKEGKIVLHIPGYQPPKTLACSIKFVKEEKYKERDYIEYLKSQECI